MPFVIECVGATWQEDFLRLVPKMERYAGHFFRGERDREDKKLETVYLLLENLRKRWRQGETIRVVPCWLCKRVRAGYGFVQSEGWSTGVRKSVPTVNADEAVFARLPAPAVIRREWADIDTALIDAPPETVYPVQVLLAGGMYRDMADECRLNRHKWRRLIRRFWRHYSR